MSVTHLEVSGNCAVTLHTNSLTAQEPIICVLRGSKLTVEPKHKISFSGGNIIQMSGGTVTRVFSNNFGRGSVVINSSMGGTAVGESAGTISVSLSDNKKLEVDGVDVTSAVRELVKKARTRNPPKDETKYSLPENTVWCLSNVSMSGSTEIVLPSGTLSSNRLDIRCSGASSVRFRDRETVRDVDIGCSGASKVVGNGLLAKHLTVTCSGASKAKGFHCTDSLTANARGASSLEATREEGCRVSKQSSGAGKIRIDVIK
jgi:hypothetical protein